nr:hypothetical protein A4A49_06396 [Ipomoea batatas]
MRTSAHYPSPLDDPSWSRRHMTERTPVVVGGGRYQQYPDAQMITKGCRIIFDDPEDQIAAGRGYGIRSSRHQTPPPPSVFCPGNHHVPEPHKKAVHFVEYQKATEINNNDDKQLHQHKSFDIETEADIFIKRKHKNFELAKMDTFIIN